MNLKNILSWGFGITVLCFGIVWYLFIANPFTNYQESFSNYGTFLQGTLGVVLTAANVLLLIWIWWKQKEESGIKHIEDRFFHLLTIRKEMRSEIRAYSHHDNGNNKHYKPERGNDAINELAGSFASAQNNATNQEELIENLKILYRRNGAYLRHYFDFILFIIDYIDNQRILSKEQKFDFIRVLTADSSYNELLIWNLMLCDYEEGEMRQEERLLNLHEKYDLFRNRIFIVP
jgi:hypothetical protein